MKRKINWWMVMVAVLLALTPLLIAIGSAQRGYFAIGGEAFIWMFPLIPAWIKRYPIV